MHNPLIEIFQNKMSFLDKLNIVKRIQGNWNKKEDHQKIISELITALTDEVNSEQLFLDEARKLIEYNVYIETRDYLENVLPRCQGEEKLREVYFLLARCCHGQGLVEEALHYLDRSLLLQSNDSSHWNLKADCLLELGEWQEAISCLNKSLRSSPKEAETIYRLGSIYLFHGEYGEALNCFSGCCKLKPFNPDYWEMKAEMLLKLGQTVPASECFNKAVKFGGSIHAMTRLAYCLARVGEIKKALKLLTKVLKYEPDNFDALCNLAGIYHKLDKDEQAYKLMKKAHALNCNDHLLLNNLGFICFALGRSRKAVEYYQAALKINQDDFIVLYNLGVCLADKGKWEEAREALERLTSLDNKNTDAWALLGNVYEQLSKHNIAVDCFNKSLGLAR